MTKKLFYENAHLNQFLATVISCEPADNGLYNIALDCTAFYPLGGGQPADTGVFHANEKTYLKDLLNRSDENINISDTREREGIIYHVADAPLAAGETVTGSIDWSRRFALMQHHTGEHIVSGLARKFFGLDNVGFHMGDEFTTMDLNGELDSDSLNKLETFANEAIYLNKKVYSRYPAPDELERLDYRSKITLSSDVRIVTVEGYDECACCGLHCDTTGEVGIIKIVQAQKYKSGMRLYLLCGTRAVEDYNRKNQDIYMLSRLFSAKPEEAAAMAKQMYEENLELKYRLTTYRLDALKAKADAIEPSEVLLLFEDSLTSDELRKFCLKLCEKSKIAVVFSSVNVSDDSFRYAVGCFNADAREYAKQLNASLNGRGGGQKNLAQGTVNAQRQEIEQFVRREFH